MKEVRPEYYAAGYSFHILEIVTVQNPFMLPLIEATSLQIFGNKDYKEDRFGCLANTPKVLNNYA